jgi:hypothetical protein
LPQPVQVQVQKGAQHHCHRGVDVALLHAGRCTTVSAFRTAVGEWLNPASLRCPRRSSVLNCVCCVRLSSNNTSQWSCMWCNAVSVLWSRSSACLWPHPCLDVVCARCSVIACLLSCHVAAHGGQKGASAMTDQCMVLMVRVPWPYNEAPQGARTRRVCLCSQVHHACGP